MFLTQGEMMLEEKREKNREHVIKKPSRRGW
jgi:hypothetical protein